VLFFGLIIARRAGKGQPQDGRGEETLWEKEK